MEIEEIIQKYKMDEMQQRALKFSRIWEYLAPKEFPGEKTSKLKDTGDPRKCFLFKCCYKLATETNGIIPIDDYKLYILAQLQIMKSLNHGGVHPLITPQILVGDKAWVRWRIWCYKNGRVRKKIQNSDDLNIKIPLAKIQVEIDKSKKYFLEHFKKIPEEKDLQSLISDLTLIRLVKLGAISPYYILLSKNVKKVIECDYDQMFLFNFEVYKDSITQEVRDYFTQEFGES